MTQKLVAVKSETRCAIWRTVQYNGDMDEDAKARLGRFLTERRERQGWKLEALARKCGLHFSTLSRYERGERGERVTSAVLRKLGIAYEVPVEQLDAIMRGETPPQQAPPPLPDELLEQYRLVAPVAIPVTEHPAHAGHVGSPVIDYVYVERSIAANRELVCIPVVGDCMAPLIADGDRVIADREAWPEQGQIAIAVVDERVFVRRFYLSNSHIILRADNREYSDIEATEADIVGVVLEIRKYPYRPGGA